MEEVTFESTLGTMEFPGEQGGEQNLGTRFSMSKSWTHGEAPVMLERNVPEGGGGSRDRISRQGLITKDLSVTLRVEFSPIGNGSS